MGTASLWACLAALFAGITGYLCARALFGMWKRRDAIVAMFASDKKEQLIARLRGCAAWCMPVAKRLMSIRGVSAWAHEATLVFDAGRKGLSEVVIVSLIIEGALVMGVLGLVLTRSLVFGIAVCGIVIIAFVGFVKNRSERRNIAMREDIPEALRSMITCFRAGQSLPQALDTTAHEVGSSLGRLFGIAAQRLQVGDTTTEALSILEDRKGIPELSFVAVALDVQHKSGGSIAPVLEAAQESIESELALTRSLRVQTAQAKLSATIVTIMPFVLIAFFSALSPDFLAPFFGSLLGMALLGVAFAMQIIGVLVVRHMLRVDTV